MSISFFFFLFLTCRKVSPLLLQVLRQWEQAPLLGSITESTVSRKEAAECKIQGGSRHVELAREVVWKRECSKVPLEIIPGITEGRVCQSLAKPVYCSLGSDHTGLYSGCEWSALDAEADTCAVSMCECHSLSPGWATCITSSSRWSNTS